MCAGSILLAEGEVSRMVGNGKKTSGRRQTDDQKVLIPPNQSFH
jgi:hypothetical protein